MRRLTAAMAASLLTVAGVAGAAGWAAPAAAQPSATPEAEQPAVAEPVPGEEVCAIADPRLVELSGLVATDDGYLVVNDGTEFAERQGVFVLDGQCQVTDQILYPTDPRDPEDLALDREANVLWVGDIGDNFETSGGEPRLTVALWRVDLGGDRVPVIHRFTYPDGQPRDAEALLLTGDGIPVIVTKAVGGAELFVPGELRPSSSPEDAVALSAVGEFTPQDTGADHPLGPPAALAVTGGANAPDNSTVVLRTYTDAYEFDVADGDVAAAIADGEPRVTPLRDEPLGEAISYSADGERFVTVSEAPADGGYTPAVLSYAPAAPPAPEPEEGGAAEAAPGESSGGGSLFDNVQDIINLIAIVGVIGVLLVVAGIVGIVRARRRSSGGGKGGPGNNGPPAGPVTGRARLSEPPDQPGGRPAGVYTSRVALQQADPGYGGGGEYRGTEYGGGGYRGGEHGDGGGYGYREDTYRGGYDQPYDQDQDESAWANGHRGGGQGARSYQAQGGPADPGYGYQGGEGYEQYAPQGGGGYRSGNTYGAPAQPDSYEEPPDGYGRPPSPGGYPGQQGGNGHYPANGHYSHVNGRYPDAHGANGQPGPEPYHHDGYRGEGYSDDPDYPYEFRQRPSGRW